MSDTPKTEEKFRIDDLWFYRGNKSNTWLARVSRLDGSMCGISEKVPQNFWPFLEQIAALKAELERVRKDAAIVPINRYIELIDCMVDMATGRGGWAWEGVLKEHQAIYDAAVRDEAGGL